MSSSSSVESDSLNESHDQTRYTIVYGNQYKHRSQILISWENLNFVVKTKEGEEPILKNLSGFANPGEILAIMGSSGAGKTSLLNVLAGRTTSSSYQSITGNIYANGIPSDQLPFRDFSAYVTQQDILLPVLTPQEAITFSAKLRCEENDVSERVQKLITDLKLKNIMHNRIGSIEQKGISGGERKRVCIAVELVSDPCALFLDEPTSGLDAYTAEVLFKLLVKQAKKGRTIITTIHQPSKNMFSMFNRLIVMTEGEIVYQGYAENSLEHFSSLGYSCPPEINPADHFIKVLYVKNRHQLTAQEMEKLNCFRENYKQDIPALTLSKENLPAKKDTKENSFLFQTNELFRRAFKNAVRNPGLSKIKLMQSLGLSILIDMVFNESSSDLEGVQTTSGLLFFIVTSQVLFGYEHAVLSCNF